MIPAWCAALLAVLAWGALSFGAVYPWAYWPLLIGAVTVGVMGLLAPRRSDLGRTRPRLTFALAGIMAAVLLQLVPLPADVLARLSPAAVALVEHPNLTVGEVNPVADREASGPPSDLALSVAPDATWRGLAFLAALAILLIGCARLLSTGGTAGLARGVMVLGFVMALVGIMQKATYDDVIYGFWQPRLGGNPFGPFVNRNHFAGWMIMALSLATGEVCARIARDMRGVRPDWRSRLLWLSSPSANQLVLAGLAVLVMGLSLVLAMSRSGIACFALSLVVSGWFVSRKQATRSRRVLNAGYLTFVFVVAVGWVGVDAVGQRFADADWFALGGRRNAWADAARIARDFPLAGTGLNTYGTATLVYQTHDLDHHYVEAHNDYLQIAAEGGLLLGVPVLMALGLFVREVRQRFREGEADETSYWLRAGAVTGLVAIALQEVVEFSLQVPGNAVLFVVLAAIALHKAPMPPARTGRSHRVVREM